jgi:hypothetical protein
MMVGDSVVAPGGSLSVSGTGFTPGERVAIELHSTPVTLALSTADATGAIAAEVTIPAGTEPGEHTIVLTGLDSGRTASAAITVTQAATGAAAALPATGAALPVGLMVLGGALAIGGGVIVSRSVLRNRKAS